MSARVLRGDVRYAHGRNWVVLRTERGRRGEHRTMVVVGLSNRDGVLVAMETRGHSTVATWPTVGRGLVSIRDAGGCYFAPKRGALPSFTDHFAAIECPGGVR